MLFRLDSIFDWINTRSPVWIFTPWASNIGNCAEEIYYALIKARRDQKKVVISRQRGVPWKFGTPVANPEIFELESDHSAVGYNSKRRLLIGWVLGFVYGPWRTIHLIYAGVLWRIYKRWPKLRLPYRDLYSIPRIGEVSLFRPEGTEHFSWEAVERLDWKKQYSECLPVRLSDEMRRSAEKIRVEMGLPESDWFVCLHVREGGYRDDWGGKSHLNCSINNFTKGIKLVTDMGGWVVRFGDSSMTPLPDMDRVIDYPHTRFKSSVMDLYLVSECRFYVGVNSGPLDLAWLFQKPMVVTNVGEWCLHYPVRKGDLAIFKHIFSKSRNRFMSLAEILDESGLCQSYPFPDTENYVMYENSEEEIRDVVEEFLTRPETFEYSELQETFNRELALQMHRWLDDELPAPPERYLGDLTKFRIAARTDASAGAVGQKYLEQNWLADSLGENVPNELIA